MKVGIPGESKILNKKGFTLIEVLVTVIVSGVLFITVGVLMVHMQTFSFKNLKELDMVSDQRFARLMIGRELRKADTYSIDLLDPTYINITQGAVAKTIKIDDSNNIIVDNTTDGETKMILSDAVNLVFTSTSTVGMTHTTLVEVYIEQEKVTDFASGMKAHSDFSFTVYLRNED